MFANASHCSPSLIFASMAWSITPEWSPISDSTLVSYSLSWKYSTTAEVNGTVKHSSLLKYNIGPKSYEDEIFLRSSHEAYSQHFIFCASIRSHPGSLSLCLYITISMIILLIKCLLLQPQTLDYARTRKACLEQTLYRIGPIRKSRRK